MALFGERAGRFEFMMQRLQNSAKSLRGLRRHPDRKIRVAWHSVAFALLAALLLVSTLRQIGGFLWICANLLLYFVAAVWGVFHLRALRPASPPSLRWAFVGTLFAALWLFANIDNWLRQYVDKSLTLPSAAITFTVLFSVPFLFFGVYIQGIISGAVTAFWLRKRPIAEADRAVSATVSVAWIGTGAFFLLDLPFFSESPLLRPSSDLAVAHIARGVINALQWGSAFPILWITLYWMRITAHPRPVHARLMRRFSEQFMLGFRWRGRRRTLDLRGAALGLLASLLTLALTQTALLAPLQAVTLKLPAAFAGNAARRQQKTSNKKKRINNQSQFLRQKIRSNRTGGSRGFADDGRADAAAGPVFPLRMFRAKRHNPAAQILRRIAGRASDACA